MSNWHLRKLSKTPMQIRKATENDIEQWSQMRTALWPDTPDHHIREINDYFAGDSIDIVEVYIAELDKMCIGFIELNIRNFAEGSRQSQVPYVEGWYIKPEYQNKGYGKALMQQAEQWATTLGYKELASDTQWDNEKSIAMHKNMGYKETERVVCFLKTL